MWYHVGKMQALAGQAWVYKDGDRRKSKCFRGGLVLVLFLWIRLGSGDIRVAGLLVDRQNGSVKKCGSSQVNFCNSHLFPGWIYKFKSLGEHNRTKKD